MARRALHRHGRFPDKGGKGLFQQRLQQDEARAQHLQGPVVRHSPEARQRPGPAQRQRKELLSQAQNESKELIQKAKEDAEATIKNLREQFKTEEELIQALQYYIGVSNVEAYQNQLYVANLENYVASDYAKKQITEVMKELPDLPG